jgi:hypothetical protein
MLLRDVLARAMVAAAPAAGAPAGTRPVELIAYTGGIVDVGNGPEVFDLAGIDLGTSGIPLLVDHDDARVAGYSTKAEVIAWRDPSGPADALALPALRLLGRLMVDDEEPEGRRIGKRSDQGFPQQASVRLEVLEEELVPAGEKRTINGREFVGPFIHDKRSRLRETSFVSLGADANTRAVAARKAKESVMAAENAPPPAEDEKKPEEKEEEVMAEVAASADELDAAFPDHPRFCMDQLKAGASLSKAQAAYNTVLSSELKEAKAALAKKSAGPKVPAVRPAGDTGDAPSSSPTGTKLAQFKGLIRDAVAKGMTREAAARKVANENPDLHRQVLAEANPGKPEPTYRAGR